MSHNPNHCRDCAEETLGLTLDGLCLKCVRKVDSARPATIGTDAIIYNGVEYQMKQHRRSET